MLCFIEQFSATLCYVLLNSWYVMLRFIEQLVRYVMFHFYFCCVVGELKCFQFNFFIFS